MFKPDFITLLVVLVFAGLMAYQVSLFKHKKIGYFTLLQIIYLVVIPGFLFPMAFSYMRSIMKEPFNNVMVMPDNVAANIILLSLLFTYGGIAIHAVTKMIDDRFTLKEKSSEAAKMNRFFHYTFSHNLIYSGGVLVMLGFSLLELNHIPTQTPELVMWVVVKGLILGFSLMLSIYSYEPYMNSRWSDLKTFFLVLWLGLMAILYGIRKTDPKFGDYELLIPALLSFSLMAFLSLVVVYRRLKRGGRRIWIGKRRLKNYLSVEERA